MSFYRITKGLDLGLCGDSSCDGSSRESLEILEAASSDPDVIELTGPDGGYDLWMHAVALGSATIEVELQNAPDDTIDVTVHEPDEHEFSVVGDGPFEQGARVQILSRVWGDGVELASGLRPHPYVQVDPPEAGNVDGNFLNLFDDLELVSEITGERLQVDVDEDDPNGPVFLLPGR